jgi:hypothetical protein
MSLNTASFCFDLATLLVNMLRRNPFTKEMLEGVQDGGFRLFSHESDAWVMMASPFWGFASSKKKVGKSWRSMYELGTCTRVLAQ